jgi:hypothetical protein
MTSFTETKKNNSKIHTEAQNSPNSQNNPEQKRAMLEVSQ